MSRTFCIALLYVGAVIVLLIGWWRTATGRNAYGAGFLAAALALLAFSLSAVAAGFHWQ